MAWFQLDPASLAQRTGSRRRGPAGSLSSSVVLGAAGFCAVSLAGFVPWAYFGRALGAVVGEAGMYAVCAAVFMALAGLFLHRLILGPGSLGRFYRLFAIAFGAYSVAWIAGWMLLRGHPGSVAGLLAGTALMGWLLTRAFDARDAWIPVSAVLFLTNAAGYFIGGWVEGTLMGLPELRLAGSPLPRRSQMRLAMLSWGLFYGLGLGAGLGYAFHRCQRAARRLLDAAASPSSPGSAPTPV